MSYIYNENEGGFNMSENINFEQLFEETFKNKKFEPDYRNLDQGEAWEKYYDELFSLEQGSYIATTLGNLRGCIVDRLEVVDSRIGPEPWLCFSPIEIKDDFIIILEYIGNGIFLEPISGKQVNINPDNSDEMYGTVADNILLNNELQLEMMQEYEKELKKRPLFLQSLDYPEKFSYFSTLTKDIKTIYGSTTLKNQEKVIQELDEMERKAISSFDESLKSVVSRDLIPYAEAENSIIDTDKFLEEHRYKSDKPNTK